MGIIKQRRKDEFSGDRSGMTLEEEIPFFRLPIHEIFKEDRVRWFAWFFAQGHKRFFGRKVAFLGVALFACRHKICPGVLATLRARRDMVDGQIAFGPAILAFMIVALEYILPGKINALVRGVNISIEADHRRHGERLRDGMQLMPIRRSHHFAFVKKNQYECSFH
jgi:hypothetical protein